MGGCGQNLRCPHSRSGLHSSAESRVGAQPGRQCAQVVVVAADASTARPALERAGWEVVPMDLDAPA